MISQLTYIFPDILLTYLHNKGDKEIRAFDITNAFPVIGYQSIKNHLERIEDDGYISIMDSSDFDYEVTITSKGAEFIKSGGYSKNYKELEFQKQKQDFEVKRSLSLQKPKKNPMYKGNKIVRVRFEHEGKYYEDKLMRFRDFVSIDKFKSYGENKFIKPYKWWEIQRFFTCQTFRLSSLSSNNNNQALNLKSRKIIIISWAIFIIEAITGAAIWELFKLIIGLTNDFN